MNEIKNQYAFIPTTKVGGFLRYCRNFKTTQFKTMCHAFCFVLPFEELNYITTASAYYLTDVEKINLLGYISINNGDIDTDVVKNFILKIINKGQEYEMKLLENNRMY